MFAFCLTELAWNRERCRRDDAKRRAAVQTVVAHILSADEFDASALPWLADRQRLPDALKELAARAGGGRVLAVTRERMSDQIRLFRACLAAHVIKHQEGQVPDRAKLLLIARGRHALALCGD